MRIQKAKWERAKALYWQGMQWEAIGSELGLNPATLANKACAEGITKVKREIKSANPKQTTNDLETLSSLVRAKLANDALETLQRVDQYNIAEINDEAKREQVLSSVAKRSALVFGWEESQQSAQVNINLLSAMPDKSAIDV